MQSTQNPFTLFHFSLQKVWPLLNCIIISDCCIKGFPSYVTSLDSSFSITVTVLLGMVAEDAVHGTDSLTDMILTLFVNFGLFFTGIEEKFYISI